VDDINENIITVWFNLSIKTKL